jgi:hypothetical protein
LKTGPRPAPGDETEPFRSKVKTLELAAEKLENKLLTDCLPLRLPEEEIVKPERLRTVLESVVAHFSERQRGQPGVSLSSSIDTIVEAAMQDAS